MPTSRAPVFIRHEDVKHLRMISPVENASKARAPVLILHGVDDSVVPIEQGRTMHARLRRADKPVRYVELRGDDHWLSDASTRTQMLKEIETFLAEHLVIAPATGKAIKATPQA